MKNKYEIAGLRFSTKKSLTQIARQTFTSKWTRKSEALQGAEREFFLALLKHHDEWHIKTQGRPDSQIILKPESAWVEHRSNTIGLRIYFEPDNFRGDDISWLHAVKCLQPNINDN